MSVKKNEKKIQKNNKRIGYCLRCLAGFLKPYKAGLILGILMIVVANATFALNPIVEGQMTTQLYKDGEAILSGEPGAHVHFDVILGVMGTLVIIYIIKTVSQLITAVFLTKVLQQTMYDIRNALQQKIQRLPVRYFDDHAFGDVLSVVTNDVDTLGNALQQTMQRVIGAVLTFIFVISMMFYINGVLACMALVIIPLTVIVTKFFVTRTQKLFDTQQNTLGELNGTITEMYSGFNEIILYNKQEMAVDKFHDVNGRMRKTYLKEHRTVLYNNLLLTGKLTAHLQEIDEAANSRLEQMIPELAKAAGATESLKASDPMRWVGLMNTCKAQAEEIILTELINN